MKKQKSAKASKSDMKDKLTPGQYAVCFLGETEPPGSGKYYNHYEKGTYKCVMCGQELFRSDTKFKSHSGWPSFFQPIEGSVIEHDDHSYGMHRTEIRCSNCDAHLGHVFSDGPKPTGQRYCINSLALDFESKETQIS